MKIFENKLELIGTVLMLAAAVIFLLSGEFLYAATIAIMCLILFEPWNFFRSKKIDKDKITAGLLQGRIENPTPKQVLQFRKENRGVSIVEAYKALKGEI